MTKNEKEIKRLKELVSKQQGMLKKFATMITGPFIAGTFFEEDNHTPRDCIFICPMEGSDALYEYKKVVK